MNQKQPSRHVFEEILLSNSTNSSCEKKGSAKKKNSFKSLEMLARSCWECTYPEGQTNQARLQGIAQKTRKTIPELQ